MGNKHVVGDTWYERQCREVRANRPPLYEPTRDECVVEGREVPRSAPTPLIFPAGYPEEQRRIDLNIVDPKPSQFSRVLLWGDSGVGKTALFNSSTCGGVVPITKEYAVDTQDSKRVCVLGLAGMRLALHPRTQFGVTEWSPIDPAVAPLSDVELNEHIRPEVVVVMFDITNRTTFEGVQARYCDRIFTKDKWRILGLRGAILVASKVDCKAQRVVSTEEGRKLAENLGIDYCEVCTQDLESVDALWLRILTSCGKSAGFRLRQYPGFYEDAIEKLRQENAAYVAATEKFAQGNAEQHNA